jgi:hypothetical protein
VETQKIRELVYVGLHTPNIKKAVLAVYETERDGHGHQQHDLLYDVEFICVHTHKIQRRESKKPLRKQRIMLQM